MRNSSKKTPWHLRFAPGAILRQIGLAVLAVVALIFTHDVSAADAVTETHYYEKFGGDRAMCQPPMDGKITATPTIKAATNASRSKSTVNGYVDSSYPILNNKRERSDPGYMWTEYFKIHWDEIVENPAHDPDAPCSHKYMVTNDNLDNEGLHEHGDEYMMQGKCNDATVAPDKGRKPTATESNKWFGQKRESGFSPAKARESEAFTMCIVKSRMTPTCD